MQSSNLFHSSPSRVWLFSRRTDLAWLFAPVWATWLLCFVLPTEMLQAPVPLLFWVLFVVGIDVTHVWTTIFRTYLDREEFRLHRKALLRVPILCFVLLFGVALYSEAFFWRVMAYIALHHFIKQQYGFLALYRARYGEKPRKGFLSDTFMLYLGMGWPVVFWHLNQGRNFSWFITGDFLAAGQWLESLGVQAQHIAVINTVGNTLYISLFAWWLLRELLRYGGKPDFPFGKMLWIGSTAINWFLGIVWFNSDLAFSLTNVVAHGVPYMVLIFLYVERKKALKEQAAHRRRIVGWASVMQMLLIVLFLAFGEEYFWDMWLNRERETLFASYFTYPMTMFEALPLRAFALALLSVPQVSHYFIDGFIWKKSPQNPYVPQVLQLGAAAQKR